eukprot:4852518-Pleurochrysis_carterae.AAC.3
MLDIDYLGAVNNNPDGPPGGLHDQARSTSHPPGGERGRELRSTVASSQFTTLVFWRSRYLVVWPPTEKALSQRSRRCGRSSESSCWLSRYSG